MILGKWRDVYTRVESPPTLFTNATAVTVDIIIARDLSNPFEFISRAGGRV